MIIEPDGEQVWVAVGEYRHGGLREDGWMGLISLLSFEFLLALLAGVAWWNTATLASDRTGWQVAWVVIGWVLLLALIVGGIAYGSYLYARKQAFLQVGPGDVVYVYQGVPGQIGSLKLQWLVSRTAISIDAVPPADQARLREGMRFDSLAAALQRARSLEPTTQLFP